MTVPRREVGIAAGQQTLDDVRPALDALSLRHDEVPTDVRMEVRIASAEIGANILEHGRAGRLRMATRILPDAVEIEFTDDGHAAEVDLFTARRRTKRRRGMGDSGRGNLRVRRRPSPLVVGRRFGSRAATLICFIAFGVRAEFWRTGRWRPGRGAGWAAGR